MVLLGKRVVKSPLGKIGLVGKIKLKRNLQSIGWGYGLE
jgi:hypothetical protein